MSPQPAGKRRARTDREIPVDGPFRGGSDAAGVVDIDVLEHQRLRANQVRGDRPVEVDSTRTGKSGAQLDQLRANAGENDRSTAVESACIREVTRKCVRRVTGGKASRNSGRGVDGDVAR